MVLGNPRIDSGGKIIGFQTARSVVEGTSISGTEHSMSKSLFIPEALDWVTETKNPKTVPMLCPTAPLLEIPRKYFGMQANLFMS